MQPHIAIILRNILQNPHKMLPGNVVDDQHMLHTLRIEANALAQALGPDEIDAMAVKFLEKCSHLPVDGIYEAGGERTAVGKAVELIDEIGRVIIADMGGNPWDASVGLDEMAKRLNRLHFGQMSMDATLRAALEHPQAPPMEHLQAAGQIGSANSTSAQPQLWIVGNNKPGLARIWLEHGLDPNRSDEAGKTPIAYAMAAEMVSVLLEHGASLDDVDGKGTWAPDYWKSRNMSDSARMQMMEQAMTHLLEGNATIDRQRARSMVMNLPAVRKMQAAMERSSIGWWDGPAGQSVGAALCCQAAMVTDATTSSSPTTAAAKKRMQSLLSLASAAEGAGDGDNSALLSLALANMAVCNGGVPADHMIEDTASMPRVVGMVMEQYLGTMPKGSGTLKDICQMAKSTHALLADGLAIDRSWLEPLSRAATACMKMGGTADVGKALQPWLAQTFKAMDRQAQEDILPLMIPLVFYSQGSSGWDSGSNLPMLDAVLNVPCDYSNRPDMQKQLLQQVVAFREFAEALGNTQLGSRLKPVVSALEAKAMQVSCGAATARATTRPGPRF